MKRFLVLFSIYKRRNANATRHLSNSLSKRVFRLLVILFVLVLINSSAMVYFENMHVGDALWLSSTTVTTVGYGDFSPTTWQGRAITILTMYVFAITVLSLLVAETVEWRVYITEKKRRGLWEWKTMSDHIQIINTPEQDTDRYLLRFLKQIQVTPELSTYPVQILTHKYPSGLPESISKMKVLHRTGLAEDSYIINSISLDTAKYVVILARDATDTKSDSLSFDILCRVREISKDAFIVVESVSEDNKGRFIKYGANIVTRPVRAYPEMIVRFMAHPGTEKVLENFFDYTDDFLSRFDCEFHQVAWKDIVCKSVTAGFGTPLAFINASGVHTNPRHDELCSGTGIISMVNQMQHKDGQKLQNILTHD